MNTSQIPLHLIAGPQLEVRTGDVDTEEWLASALSEEIADTDNPDDISTRSSSVASRSWWESPFAQCAAGVLLKVNKKEDVPRCDGNASRITEILIYGARILDQKRCESMLPSPPPSSPSKQLRQTQETETIAEDLRACSEQPLDIFALPLSSDLLYLPVDHTTPPLSPHNTSPTEENREVTCTFLQRTLGQSSTVITNDNKRQRVTNLFDKASQRRLKARRVGSSDLTSLKICEAFHKRGRKPISFDGRSESFEGDLHESADQPSRLRRTLSSHSTFIPPDAACRISHVANYKRSSLSRTSSISNLPSPASFECEELVTRNKNFISRVVMAGLRLNGLQPTKTSSRLRRQSTVGSETIADGGNTTKKVKVDSSSDEPFKATYHMVFKATVHTFVSHASVP